MRMPGPVIQPSSHQKLTLLDLLPVRDIIPRHPSGSCWMQHGRRISGLATLFLGALFEASLALDCEKLLEPWIWASTAHVYVDKTLQRESYILPPRAQGAEYYGPGQLPDITTHLFEGRLNWSEPFRALFINGGRGERTLMLASQLAEVKIPYQILHLDASQSHIDEARRLSRAWQKKHGGGANIEFYRASLAEVHQRLQGQRFQYIDYSALCLGVDVPRELRLARDLLDPDKLGGLGISLLGSSMAGEGVARVRSEVARHGGLPVDTKDWPEAIHTALRSACGLARHMQLQPGVLDVLALLLQGNSTYQTEDIEPLLEGVGGLYLIGAASPALYPRLSSKPLPNASDTLRGDTPWAQPQLELHDNVDWRNPPGLQHAVHEIYVARRPRSQPHGVPDRPLGYDDMWARSTDLVLVPRTPSRLEYLQEAWQRGAENVTVDFGGFGPSVSIRSPPVIGAAVLDVLGRQAIHLPTLLQRALGQVQVSAGGNVDLPSFDSAFRGLVSTLLDLGWVYMLDARLVGSQVVPGESPKSTQAAGTEETARNHVPGPQGEHTAAAKAVGPWQEKQKDTQQSRRTAEREEDGARPLVPSTLSNHQPCTQSEAWRCELVVVLYTTDSVFGETAQGMVQALNRIGVRAALQGHEDPWVDVDALHILVGGNFLEYLPPRFVMLQLENLGTWIPRASGYPIIVAAAEAVWDYSPSQVEFWARRGIQAELVSPQVVLPPHPPPFVSPRSDRDQPVDVLFYGGWSERRDALGLRLKRWALRTHRVLRYGLDYTLQAGEERDKLVGMAKVVLNLHAVANRTLEVHRINYLLSMGKCVVSERSNDPTLDAWYEEAVVFVDTDTLETRLDHILTRTNDRRRREWKGQNVLYEMMQATDKTLEASLRRLQTGLVSAV